MLTSGTLSMYENSENLDLDDEIRLLDIDVIEATQVVLACFATSSHALSFARVQCRLQAHQLDCCKEYA